MSRSRRLFAGLFLMQLVLLVLFVACEAGTRWWLESRVEPPTWRRFASMEQLSQGDGGPAGSAATGAGQSADESAGAGETGANAKRYKPHRYLGYALNPGFRSGKTNHNRHGFRGPEITKKAPGEFRIVCVGGSTTYTSEVEDDALTYPGQLQRLLREGGHPGVRVINAGCGGWTTWESLINLELNLLELEPDLLVVYHAINDIHPRMVWPPEAYVGDASGYRGPISESNFTPALWEHSAFLRVVMISAGWMEPHSYATIERRLMDEHPETYYGDDFRSQKLAGTYPGGVFRRVPAGQMLDTNDPRHFARNLKSLVGVAHHRNIDVVLATFAHSNAFPRQPRVSAPEYDAAYADMNAVIARMAGETPAHLFDFAAQFPDGPELFVDGRHVNERGALLKARLFAEYLVGAGLVGGGW